MAAVLFYSFLSFQLIKTTLGVCPNRAAINKLTVPKAGTHACIAECLGLFRDRVSRKCDFMSQGKVLKEKCGTNFVPSTRRSQILVCNLKWDEQIESTFEAWKACDYIDREGLVVYNRKTQSLDVLDDNRIQNASRQMLDAKTHGIKNLLHIGSWEEESMHPEDFSQVAASSELRTKFAKDVSQIVSMYNFDGIYLSWMYIGCPQRKCKNPKDRINVILFLKEIHKYLEPEGKKIFYFTTVFFTDVLFYMKPHLTDIEPYVDFIVLESSSMMGAFSNKIELPGMFLKMKMNTFSIIGKNSAATVKKMMLAITFKHVNYQLNDLTQRKLGSWYRMNDTATSWAGIANVCEIVRNSSWIKDRNMDAQHQAIFDLNLIPYDDFELLKQKLEMLVIEKKLSGVYVMDVGWDDVQGTCGCGKMPWLRAVAELVKGGDCILKPCF